MSQKQITSPKNGIPQGSVWSSFVQHLYAWPNINNLQKISLCRWNWQSCTPQKTGRRLRLFLILVQIYTNQIRGTLSNTFKNGNWSSVPPKRSGSQLPFTNNKEARRKLNVTVEGRTLYSIPLYLLHCIKLDKSLSFRLHLESLRPDQKADIVCWAPWMICRIQIRCWRQNIAESHHCFSTFFSWVFCSCLVPQHSYPSHRKPINDALRTITGWLRPTPTHHDRNNFIWASPKKSHATIAHCAKQPEHLFHIHKIKKIKIKASPWACRTRRTKEVQLWNNSLERKQLEQGMVKIFI